MKYLQNIGKSLMMPIAVLPAAAIMLGLGYAIDSDGWGGNSPIAAFLVQSGDAILGAMGLLFAVGVAYGMTKDRDGSAALSGLVGWLVTTSLLAPSTAANLIGNLTPTAELAFGRIENVFVGILVGCIAGGIYNKFSKVELPQFLAFFNGRRLVPILVTGASAVLGLVLLFVWPPVFNALLNFGQVMVGMGALGAALYGFLNRMLIPTGLHHALNSVFWFDFAGINDLGYFWAGTDGGGVVGETGRYMAGFFPVMMFGLPGAALAMYRSAKNENKQRVYGLLLAGAVTSFVTGVTEPIEFAFMFVAPLLYVVHAVLTGISMFVVYLMGWRSGFAFSAGAIDMVLASGVPFAVNWYWLAVFGVFYFFVYYGVFMFVINKFEMQTPGREVAERDVEAVFDPSSSSWAEMAAVILEGLGGVENIVDIDNCMTRLRLEVKDSTLVNDKRIKSTGIPGIIKPSKTAVQIVVGTHVQSVADALKQLV